MKIISTYLATWLSMTLGTMVYCALMDAYDATIPGGYALRIFDVAWFSGFALGMHWWLFGRKRS